jgi:hypothetical protein
MLTEAKTISYHGWEITTRFVTDVRWWEYVLATNDGLQRRVWIVGDGYDTRLDASLAARNAARTYTAP